MVYRTHFAPKDPHNRVLNFGELDAGVCVCVRVCVCVCVCVRERERGEGGRWKYFIIKCYDVHVCVILHTVCSGMFHTEP